MRLCGLLCSNLIDALPNAIQFHSRGKVGVYPLRIAERGECHANSADLLRLFSYGTAEDVIDELVSFECGAPACLHEFNGFFEESIVALRFVGCGLFT